MKNIKKYAIIAIFSVVLIIPNVSSADTIVDLQAQINNLLAQIQQLQQQLTQIQGTTPTWCHDFNVNLKIGDSSSEVQALHAALAIDQGTPIEVNMASKYFSEETASAVSGFQQKYKSEILAPWSLQYGTGFVGKSTRAKLNSLYGCGVIPVPPPQPTCEVLLNCLQGYTQQCSGRDEKGCPICKCVPTSPCACAVPICASGYTLYDTGEKTDCGCPVMKCILISGNQPPVISGASGPTTLSINQTGTWTVQASDPEQGVLTYSVVWGDEINTGSASTGSAPTTYIQTTTFTHSYAKAGIYNPIFTVTDNQGLSAKTSINVNVGGVITSTVSEQVKCVFNGSQTEQKCYTATDSSSIYYNLNCSGKDTCVVDIKGTKGDSITWKSSCGGYAYTTMDGQSEYVEFYCLSTVSPFLSISPTNLIQGNAYTFTGTLKYARPYSNFYFYLQRPDGSMKESGRNIGVTDSTGYLSISTIQKIEGSQTGIYKAWVIGSVGNEKSNIIEFSVSSAFTPSITVLSPNGGESWQVGQTYTISWRSQSVPAGAGISGVDLLKNDTFVVSIYPSPNRQLLTTDSFSWLVPATYSFNNYPLQPGNDYKIRVRLDNGITDATIASDSSDAAFSIVAAGTSPILSVAPDATFPTANILAGSSNAEVGRFLLSNNNVSDVKIASLYVKRNNIGSCAFQYLKLYSGTTQIGSTITALDTNCGALFNLLLTIPKSTTQVISLRANVPATMKADTLAFQIAGISGDPVNVIWSGIPATSNVINIVAATTTPTCSIAFSPKPAVVGQSANVAWKSSSDASSLTYVCTGVIPGSGSAATSGSLPFNFPSSGSETCSLTIKNNAGLTGTCNDSVSIVAATTGDINGDGIVNCQDYTELNDMYLGKKIPNTASDVNGDGVKANIADFQKLINILTGKGLNCITPSPYCSSKAIGDKAFSYKITYIGDSVSLPQGWFLNGNDKGAGVGLLYKSDTGWDINAQSLFGVQSNYGCAGKIEAVWHYDFSTAKWNVFLPDNLGMSDLDIIKSGEVYSIKTKEACTLKHPNQGGFWKSEGCPYGCQNGACVSTECKLGQKIGDVDGDGYITNIDADLVAKIAAGLMPSLTNICCADINKDGIVNIVDSLKIARIAGGLESSPGSCAVSSGVVQSSQLSQMASVLESMKNLLYLLLKAIGH